LGALTASRSKTRSRFTATCTDQYQAPHISCQ
jgi:hypothetical protein